MQRLSRGGLFKVSTIMTLEEVASYLRVHPSTVYRMAKTHSIPAFKIGSDWRFNRESIDGWRVRAERGPEASPE